ncbi:MAG: TetR/AcrR family transcriptional regulator [Vicinamibacterales bacterium]
MATTRQKAAGATRLSYHHGDLPRAMVREAVRIIQKQGVGALTLRTVGEHLGVSRTALYRHFANKDALLGAVADEGFRTLRQELLAAWETGGGGRAGFNGMGLAYVRFAVTHTSHYRVMFGGFVRPDRPKIDRESTDAFGPLVQAIEAQQQEGLIRGDASQALASYIWAVVHGVAMLAVDGIITDRAAVESLAHFALERLWTGIGASPRD